MILGLKQYIPLMVKAVTEIKIKEKLVLLNVEESIKSLHQGGFQVRAVICDNHPSNVAAFRDLSQKFNISRDENAFFFYLALNQALYTCFLILPIF